MPFGVGFTNSPASRAIENPRRAVIRQSLVGIALVTALLVFQVAFSSAGVAAEIDPNLRVAISRTNQNVILSWFGSNAVSYQVESSSTLTSWNNSAPIITGNNAFLFVTNAIAGQSRDFFRIKRLIPVDVITASFDPVTGVLTIVGDENSNIIVVSRNVAGALLVNDGVISITGGVPTVANTTTLRILGRAGNDQLSLNENNGALPKSQLFGEGGNDTLTGGSGGDTVDGGSGSDTLFGRGGADTLLGGDDNDTVIGGDGDDIAQLGIGNDRFIWNPGDDTDLVEGADGIDTVEVNGGNGAENFTTTANGTRVRFDRVDPAPFSLDIGTCENLVLNANGGNDSFSATGNLAALIQITVDGGAGDDTILGSNGADTLLGGDNNDFFDGQQGNDLIFMGAGNDIFQWDPGDGSDTIEGQVDSDTLLFNGSAAAEIIDIGVNGSRLRFLRNIGNILLDLDGIETVQFNALGGADIITVSDLSPTDVNVMNLRLAGVLGGSAGDVQVDSVIINGTGGIDNISADQTGADVVVAGLAYPINIFTGEINDVITINGLGDNDIIDASLVTSLFALTIDGGAGNDTLIGSSRADTLLGGDDNDTITGRQGNDLIFGGNHNDIFIWNPGDGSDVLEGRGGADTLLFAGSNVNENMDLSANGARFRLFRDVANVTLDCDDVEKVQVSLLGGADNITVGELTSTDIKELVVDLSTTGGAGDAQADNVILNGTQTNDTILVSGTPENVAVTGLSASLTILGSGAGNDRLTINALGGADTVDASALPAGAIPLSLNGGLGVDKLIGSQGDDTFNGGDGNDLAVGEGGNDTFVWNPGDDNDTFEGRAGLDTLLFNGANIAENINLSAAGTHLRFLRDVASVETDCVGVEQVNFIAAGGADTITVNSLAGTDVTGVSLSLFAAGSTTGDGQPDNIIVNGTAANDSMIVVSSPTRITVGGLSATVTIAGSEGANDRLTVNLLAGDDVIDASVLLGGIIAFVVDGGIDDDLLIGGAGNDVLFGREGDDVLRGGPGLDVLDGGPGANIIVQD